MDIQTKTYTVSEFLAFVEEMGSDKRYELVNGEIVEMPPTNLINSIIAAFIVRMFGNFIDENQIQAHVAGADGGYAITNEDVRIPDVSVIFIERKPNLGDMKAIVSPDLAVELISPSETPRMVNEKTALYLNNGTKLVWNVYPQERVVEAWTMGTAGKLEMETFFEGASVTGGDVLPGFTLEISKIFSAVPKESKRDD